MRKASTIKIGKKLQAIRNSNGYTQEKLAEQIDVSPSYISEIERGSSICSLQVLVDIADVLHLNLDSLVNGINENNIDSSFTEILNDIPKRYHDLYITICKNIAKSFK